MERLSIREFEEQVCRYVRNALPHELEGTYVCVTRLEICEEDTCIALLVIRPWSGMVTGFCLNDKYKEYADGNATVESTAAAIINDRRLYSMC